MAFKKSSKCFCHAKPNREEIKWQVKEHLAEVLQPLKQSTTWLSLRDAVWG